MLTNVLPREICPETVDLTAVVANEEDEVLCGNVTHTTPIRVETGLQNLE
jgi:hypothetical protein